MQSITVTKMLYIDSDADSDGTFHSKLYAKNCPFTKLLMDSKAKLTPSTLRTPKMGSPLQERHFSLDIQCKLRVWLCFSASWMYKHKVQVFARCPTITGCLHWCVIRVQFHQTVWQLIQKYCEITKLRTPKKLWPSITSAKMSQLSWVKMVKNYQSILCFL